MAELYEIDGLRVDGKFLTADGTVPEGNDAICELLEWAKHWAALVWEKYVIGPRPQQTIGKLTIRSKGEIPEPFRPTYDALVGIRNKLEKLLLTQTWSMRETDLFDYQRQLDRLDEMQKNNRWVDDEGNPAGDYAQGVGACLGGRYPGCSLDADISRRLHRSSARATSSSLCSWSRPSPYQRP